MQSTNGGRPVAEVKPHSGTPTVFVDGKPSSYQLIWMPTPDPAALPLFKQVVSSMCRRTGVHFYAIENGTTRWGADGPVWIPGPRPGHEGHFDFSGVEGDIRPFIEADGDARIHLRLYLEFNPEWAEDRWWSRLYPDECLVTAAGWQAEESMASTVWREEVKEFIRKLIAHIESIGLSDRILAYQINVGSTCEWFKYALNLGASCGDYSAPMRRWFESWLRKRYAGDGAALREAWRKPGVTFETAAVPSPDEQLTARRYIFRDPASEQNVVDYLAATSDLSADLIVDFCRTAKEACHGRAIAGVFYGYWLGFQLNSDYFRDTADLPNDYARIQRTGHLGFHRTLHSPYVDFYSGPMDYAFRAIGGHCPSVVPAEAVRSHGKVLIQENDDRSWHPVLRDYGAARTVDEFMAVYRRTIAESAVSGQATWNVSIPFHIQKSEDLGGEPVALHHSMNVRDLPPEECGRFVKEFAACREFGDFAVETDRTPVAEVCVLIDDESWYWQTFRKNLELPLMEWQHVQGLARMGAPFEVHVLDDFVEERLRPFKLYIFLNAFHIDARRRDRLKREIRRDNRVAVWLYAPGAIDKDISTANMTDLAGLAFASTATPWGPFMHVTDYEHEITRGLPEDLFWGTDLNLSPTFYVSDPSARTLANIIHAQGRCAEGMAVKEFDDWRSVFVAVPNIPAPVLRGLARYAGVHLYSEAGDVLYASREILAVHTLRGGERLFTLRGDVEVVYDLFTRKLVAEDVRKFRVRLPKVSTSAYYVGNRAKISLLEK